jgi:hypothetical protein
LPLSQIPPVFLLDHSFRISWNRDGDVHLIPSFVWEDSCELYQCLHQFVKAGRIEAAPEIYILWDQTIPKFLTNVEVLLNPHPSVAHGSSTASSEDTPPD